jgi:alpha-glucosidase
VDPLLHFPHHDGSPLYRKPEGGPLGSKVQVRVRTSNQLMPDAVWLRTVEDGEPFFAECAVERTVGDTTWWTGTVSIHNPVQRYRFMVTYGETFVWLNQAGVFDRDVTDAHDFTVSCHAPAPGWGRDAIVYQIFPDRFARSKAADDRPIPDWAVPAQWGDAPIHDGPHTPLQFFGGDLDGITEHLDHVAGLGVTTIYLTPVFPGESNHRYNASTFDEVDPLLGGDEAYRRLIDAAHERGMRVLGDLTSNHTGDTHEWFVDASADPDSEEHGYYYFAADGSHEGWKGHGTLPKLDHLAPGLGERFRAVVTRWLDFGIDGWRIDVANMTGRHVEVDIAHDVAREVRRAATEVRPDALVLAEHGHDATGDLDRGGWHGTMNYAGFTRPVWSWLASSDAPDFLGVPGEVYRIGAADVAATMRDFGGLVSWRSLSHSWTLLGSHDTARIRTVVGSAALQEVAAGLLFTLPGTPMVFAGDEWGLTGWNGEASRTPMPWDRPERQDAATFARYRDLIALRSSTPALRNGGLRWAYADGDTLAFFRGTLLVLARRAPGPPLRLHDCSEAENLYGGMDLVGADIPGDGPTFQVWRLG